MSKILAKLGDAIFKINGWTYDADPAILSDKQVIIGFEHTSNLDTILSLALFRILNVRVHTLIKKELFKGPMKPLLEALGGIAVDRQASTDVVAQMAKQFAAEDKFTLVIAPEATRAKGETDARKPIKTGFWHIAKAANVPIVLMFANSRTKHGGLIGKIIPGDDLQADLQEIKRRYQEIGIEVFIPEASNKPDK